jgi:type I restriction-modification system DNA methylase subunit
MELFKSKDVYGQITKRGSDGTVDVDFAGTVLTMDESENELLNKKEVMTDNIQEFRRGGYTGTPTEQYSKAVSDLNQRQTFQDDAKKINKEIRDHKLTTAESIVEHLTEKGYSEELIEMVFEYSDGRFKIPAWKLTNNNSKLKRLKVKVEMLKRSMESVKQTEKTGDAEEYAFEGGTVLMNYDIDRVQIIFDSGRVEKPLYKQLRSSGWVYSPTNSAFQRKITPQALQNAIRMFDAKRVASKVKDEETEFIAPDPVKNKEKSGEGLDAIVDTFQQTVDHLSPITVEIHSPSQPSESHKLHFRKGDSLDSIKDEVLTQIPDYDFFVHKGTRYHRVPLTIKTPPTLSVLDKVDKLAKYITKQLKENSDLSENWELHKRNSEMIVQPLKSSKQKYIKLDMGGSGKYMIEVETGDIYGVKGYGVIHRGHIYGNVDDYFDGTRKIDTKNTFSPLQRGDVAPAKVEEPAPQKLTRNDWEIDVVDTIYERTTKDIDKSGVVEMINQFEEYLNSAWADGEDPYDVADRIIEMDEELAAKAQPISKEAQDIIRPEWDKMKDFLGLEPDDAPETLGSISGGAVVEFDDEVGEIIDEIEKQGEMPRSDAQGIFDVHVSFAKEKYGLGLSPADIALAILKTPDKSESPKEFALHKEEHTEGHFHGLKYEYDNQYVLNKAIEELLQQKGTSHEDYSTDEKSFIRKYSGYGGLDEYGKTGAGGLFEYYTPPEIIERMWGLAYKYGYNDGKILEPSIGTGEFLQYMPPNAQVTGYDINPHSSKICKILYPTVNLIEQPFEKTFIDKNYTVKDRLDHIEKVDLVIGNPPYGAFDTVKSRYMSMGELDHTKARNYVEYFLRRSVDLLNKDGLLVFIVGASVQGGGTMFLDSGMTPVKEYLAANCDLKTAYRLPDSIFERTGVTSDIIVLKKN